MFALGMTNSTTYGHGNLAALRGNQGVTPWALVDNEGSLLVGWVLLPTWAHSVGACAVHWIS